ncbi:MAG: 3-oxoacyl-[acyl-carrier protein] reductase [Gammaproteobacteria bacterium]|jgi:3-oxoacyl-[acyl-carrier protein] reductase
MNDRAQIVLITGASRGIGAAIAQAFANDGAIVVGTATTQAGAAQVSERLAVTGGRGEIVDVASGESVDKLFARLAESQLLPSVVVNNAGITRDNLLARMKDEEWNDVIETDLSSIYRVCKAAARPMMKARYGRIVNVGSVVGSMGNAGQANYAAAKAGMLGFTRALARELGGRGITVNAVAPGFINTDMTSALSDAQQQVLLGQIPLKRLGEADDIAAAVVFLCSNKASYITGETLHINGGLYMS